MIKTITIIFAIFVFGLLFSCGKMLLGPDTENTAQENFQILWDDFDRHYFNKFYLSINKHCSSGRWVSDFLL